MERKLEYRIWSPRYEEMYYLLPTKQRYDYEMGLVLAFAEGGYPDFNGHEKYSDEEDFITMQYTNLEAGKIKDVKTKIFEDDILKVQLPLGGFWGDIKKEKIGRVRYEADYGGYIVEWGYSKNQHHVRLDCDVACEAKVLGNIHQNKEIELSK